MVEFSVGPYEGLILQHNYFAGYVGTLYYLDRHTSPLVCVREP